MSKSLPRTKEQMVNDVYNVIQLNNVTVDAKKAVLDNVLWSYNSNNNRHGNKYTKCSLWSIRAINKFHEEHSKVIMKSLVSNRTNAKFNFGDHFTYEHVIPRNIISKRIFQINESNELTTEKIKKILDDCLISVVITKVEEDKLLEKSGLRESMPRYLESKTLEDYTIQDIWSRYTCLYTFFHTRINVFNVDIRKDKKSYIIKLKEPIYQTFFNYRDEL